MTDTPSSILLLRLQSVGSNTNLWGGYLNTALATLERAAKGTQALAVTGDATVSWTNYAATNDGAVAFLKLTGSLSSAAALTFPGYQHYMGVWNTTGNSVTIKCSGGTGVILANGDRALLFCDGTDYYNAAPTVFSAGLTVAGAITMSGQLSGVTAATSGTQAINKTQMDAAIAAAITPVGGGTVRVDASAAAGYLYDVLTVSGSLTKTDNGDTMDIGFVFDEGQTALYAGVMAL